MNNLKFVEKSKEKIFLEKIKKIEWVCWLNRPYSVFMGTIFWGGVRRASFERIGFEGLEPNNNLYQFPDIYFDKKFEEKGVTYFKKYFESHRMLELSDSLEKFHSYSILELKKVIADKNSTVVQKLASMCDLVQDYIPYLWLTVPLESYFSEVVAKEIPKYIKGDYSKFVGDISISNKKNVYGLMLEELKSGTPVKEIQKKYGWMKSRDGFTDFYTEEEILEIKKGMKQTDNHEDNRIEIPKGLLWLAEELKESTFFRTSRTDKFYEFFGVARPLMEQVANYIGVGFKDLADYDAISIIAGEPKKYNENFNYVIIGNDYSISNDKFIDFSGNLSSKVEGRTAFQGLVRGIVKIVTHPNDLGKVNDGDILVAQMTLPSFISAMQKAAAFVTDEGGITCHAAIVAREMGKPCIIGTKIATKVLKDGDLVEVDADKGIVKILKK